MLRFNYQNIKILQAEISNHCNASCPQCPRNVFGGAVVPNLPLNKWRVSDLDSMFRVGFVQNLEMLYLCGTYGDPMTHPAVVAIVDWFRDRNPDIRVGIHTNGGVGRIEDYQRLAETVDFIGFGIDGLADTNHLYRRHTRWSSIMDRARAFIDAGGRAVWDFIVFEHNQHQVERARTLAGTLGFAEFNIKRTARFLNRKHEIENHLPVLDRKGVVQYELRPPTDAQYLNAEYDTVQSLIKKWGSLDRYAQQTKIQCNAHRIKEVYVAADGMVFPCGWLHDRLYGPEVETTDDHIQMKTMLKSVGGWQRANIHHTDLENIVNGAWFDAIADSWGDDTRLQRCGMMCGAEVNVIGEQNTDIEYKQ